MSHCDTPADAGHCHAQDDDHGHHVVSWKLLTAIFGVLMVLTIMTVAAIQIDLGSLNIVIAMAIAVVKGSLVVYYFMHLKWDRAFHALCILLAIAFVGIMIGYTLIDTDQFKSNIHAADVAAKRAATK